MLARVLIIWPEKPEILVRKQMVYVIPRLFHFSRSFQFFRLTRVPLNGKHPRNSNKFDNASVCCGYAFCEHLNGCLFVCLFNFLPKGQERERERTGERNVFPDLCGCSRCYISPNLSFFSSPPPTFQHLWPFILQMVHLSAPPSTVLHVNAYFRYVFAFLRSKTILENFYRNDRISSAWVINWRTLTV